MTNPPSFLRHPISKLSVPFSILAATAKSPLGLPAPAA